MKKYKSFSHYSRSPGLQHMKVLYQHRTMENMLDVVPEMVYSTKVDFERTFYVKCLKKVCYLSCSNVTRRKLMFFVT